MFNKIKGFLQGVNLRETFQKSPIERQLVTIFVVLTAGFLLYRSVIETQITRLKAASLQAASQEKLLAYYGNLEEGGADLKIKVDKQSRHLDHIHATFVKQTDLSKYFDDFRALVDSCSVELLSLSIKHQEKVLDVTNKPLDFIEKLGMDIYLRGCFPDLMSLLNTLERNELIFDISSIDLTSAGEESYDVEMNIVASIYIFDEKS